MSPPPIGATSGPRFAPPCITVQNFVKKMQLNDVRNVPSAQMSGRLHANATGNLLQLELGGCLARARSVLESSMPASGDERLEKAIGWLTAGTKETPGPEVLNYFTVLGGVLTSLDHQLERDPNNTTLQEQWGKIEHAVRRLGKAMSACAYPPAGSFDPSDKHATKKLVQEYGKCEAAVSDCMEALGIESQIEVVAQAVVAPMMLEAIAIHQPDMLAKAKAGQLGFEQLMNVLEPNRVQSANNQIASALRNDNFRSYWAAINVLMKLPEYVEKPDPGKAGRSREKGKNDDQPIPQKVLDLGGNGGAPVLYNKVKVGGKSQQAHGAQAAHAQVTKDLLDAFAGHLKTFFEMGKDAALQGTSLSGQLACVRNQRDDLQNQSDDLQRQKNELQEQKNELQEQKNELQEQKNELQEQKNELQEQKNELQEQKNELQEQNNALMDANHALWMKNGEVTETIAKLTDKNAKLTEVIDGLNQIVVAERRPDDGEFVLESSGDTVNAQQPNPNEVQKGTGYSVVIEAERRYSSRTIVSEETSESWALGGGKVLYPSQTAVIHEQPAAVSAVTKTMIMSEPQVGHEGSAASSAGISLARFGHPNPLGTPVDGLLNRGRVRTLSQHFERRSSAQSSQQAVVNGILFKNATAQSSTREDRSEVQAENGGYGSPNEEFQAYLEALRGVPGNARKILSNGDYVDSRANLPNTTIIPKDLVGFLRERSGGPHSGSDTETNGSDGVQRGVGSRRTQFRPMEIRTSELQQRFDALRDARFAGSKYPLQSVIQASKGVNSSVGAQQAMDRSRQYLSDDEQGGDEFLSAAPDSEARRGDTNVTPPTETEEGVLERVQRKFPGLWGMEGGGSESSQGSVDTVATPARLDNQSLVDEINMRIVGFKKINRVWRNGLGNGWEPSQRPQG